MKTKYAVILSVLLLLVSGCAQKVNDPADVQAIKNMDATYDKSYNAGNAEVLVSENYTNDAVRFISNAPSAVGKDAVRGSYQKRFDLFTEENRVITEDVRVSGDLAVAKGTYENKSSLKAGGYSAQDKGKWLTAMQRQPDGSWRAFWDMGISDLPVADALPLGQEELAILRIEQEWATADMKADVAVLDKIMASGWAENEDGKITTKAQAIAKHKSGILKVESATVSDVRIIVFGDTATVHGLWTTKATEKGKDTSAKYRFADVFVKRDGRWQVVTSYTTKVQ